MVGTVLDSLDQIGDVRILVMPDHPTPVEKMTHTKDPVPFIAYDSNGALKMNSPASGYSEEEAKKSGILVQPGHQLLDRLIKGEIC